MAITRLEFFKEQYNSGPAKATDENDTNRKQKVRMFFIPNLKSLTIGLPIKYSRIMKIFSSGLVPQLLFSHENIINCFLCLYDNSNLCR